MDAWFSAKNVKVLKEKFVACVAERTRLSLRMNINNKRREIGCGTQVRICMGRTNG